MATVPGQPAITAQSFAAHRRGTGDVELTVAWRIENRTTKPVYVLRAQPLEIPAARPVVLDHSSNGGAWKARPNVIPGFEIVAITSGASAQLDMTYHLPVPADHREIAVIGRFGYSFTAPLPEWVATKNWKQVAAWQTVVDTAPITVAIQ